MHESSSMHVVMNLGEKLSQGCTHTAIGGSYSRSMSINQSNAVKHVIGIDEVQGFHHILTMTCPYRCHVLQMCTANAQDTCSRL